MKQITEIDHRPTGGHRFFIGQQVRCTVGHVKPFHAVAVLEEFVGTDRARVRYADETLVLWLAEIQPAEIGRGLFGPDITPEPLVVTMDELNRVFE